ncbi:hypothetical protein MYX76_10170 [Desulfobacterota bacterium AH_259_B03_O07]|nr:hypothetical protein [Desulfobacterota bacterium AH_259_B03_O07]
MIEHTKIGIILKKKVDENIEYVDAWEGWITFTRNLYEDLLNFVGE